jgi:putative transcription factor
MTRCELCGSDVDSLTTVKVSSAEMDVCSSCEGHGTVVEDQENEQTETESKYSTDGNSSTSQSTNSGGSSSESSGRYRDDSEEFTALPPDYGDRVQQAREDAGLSRQELARQLQEKESLIRRVENNETQPTKDLQSRIENKLDLSLADSGADTDFDTDSSSTGLTIGDVVERE